MAELRRYLGHFSDDKLAFVVAAVLMSLAAAIPGAAVLLLERALDTVLAEGSRDELLMLALVFAGLYVLDGAVRLLRVRLTKGIALRVTSDVRQQLHAHYLRLSPAQQGTTGERIATLTHDIDQLQYGVSAIVTAFRNPLTLLVLAATASMMAPVLALWALCFLPLLALTSWWAGRRLRHRARDQRAARSGLLRLMQDQLAGLLTIQAYRSADAESLLFARADEVDREARLAVEVERVLPSVLVQLVAAVAVAVLLWTGGRQVQLGQLGIGQLVGFVVALGLMSRPLVGLAEVWSLMQRSLAALERVYATLDLEPEVRDPDIHMQLPSGQLELRWGGVSVDYGNGLVLNKLVLVARPAQILAIVGPTGAGKSTLLKLVGRQIDPDAGQVRLAEVDVTAVSLDQLRRAVATVPQAEFVFARTVAENVRLGAPKATDAQVIEALELAGAKDLLARLPAGIDTPLDELGAQLSGGERQRICLARALAGDARVLLLDEATNQVDAKTEEGILQTLRGLREGRTIVIVAHDLSVARMADQVAMVQQGRLVELGTHDELIRNDGPYAQLWRASGML